MPHPTPPALLRAVRQILADADAEIAAHQPLCQSSGRCCQFETHGHLLYVTAAELALFAATHAPPAPLPLTPTISLPQFFAGPALGCPYQVAGLCTARAARPLGCRVYFCDPAAQTWQNDLYERCHARLQALHTQFNLPYAYLEWRAALRTLCGP